MKFLPILIFSAMSMTSFATKPLMIERQGQFPVGGTTIERPGTFDPDTFTGWTNPVQDGQTYRCDHAFARYQIPVNAKSCHLYSFTVLVAMESAGKPRLTGVTVLPLSCCAKDTRHTSLTFRAEVMPLAQVQKSR